MGFRKEELAEEGRRVPKKRLRSSFRQPGPKPKFRALPDSMKERLRLGDDDETIIWVKGRIPGKAVYAQTRFRKDLAHKTIEFDHVVYAYHRVVWFLHHGEQPMFIIDHVDRDGTNNHPSNLRRATPSQNQANCRGRGERDLPKGVTIRKGRIVAQISKGNGGVRCLGAFPTVEAAHAAYMDAARERFGEFARGGA